MHTHATSILLCIVDFRTGCKKIDRNQYDSVYKYLLFHYYVQKIVILTRFSYSQVNLYRINNSEREINIALAVPP
jgi:hypothetical protein